MTCKWFFSGYVAELVERVIQLREEYPSYSRAEALVARHPDNLTDDMDLVPKEEVMARYQTRFNRWSISVYFDGFVQDCSNSIANALELLQSYTKLSI